jgi:hypothetical protein
VYRSVAAAGSAAAGEAEEEKSILGRVREWKSLFLSLSLLLPPSGNRCPVVV